MKKILSILLALALVFALAACGGSPSADPPASSPDTQQPSPPPESPSETPSAPPPSDPAPVPQGPVAEEVRGVTIPAFEVFANGVSVTHETMAAYPVYSVQATSINSAGTESTAVYIGFAIVDVLAAAGLTENYVWLEATASDGYTVTVKGDAVLADTTLLAMTRDGSPYTDAPWLAPCTDTVSGNYLKGAVSILVNTTDGSPGLSHTFGDGSGASDGLPEIADRTDRVEFEPYSFLVNGIEVTNETLEGLRIFRITALTVNNAGEERENTYTGYQLGEVLARLGLDDATTVTAVATDGYEAEYDYDAIISPHTLVAIERDRELGEDGTIWIAPCAETGARSYARDVVELVTG